MQPTSPARTPAPTLHRGRPVRVAVIGGGAAGLAAAHRLLAEPGLEVTVLEAERMLGGLASWFPIGGEYLERYHHFLCTGDREYLRVAAELGLGHALRWRRVRMGYFYEGRRYDFGSPWDLLRFPHLSVTEKLRVARAVHRIKSRPREAWRECADRAVVPWLRETFGDRAYEILHEPLLTGKFGAYREHLSAAWMWARMHRVGKSHSRWLHREIYGYLEGGSYRLLETLANRVRERRGRIEVDARVDEIAVAGDGRVEGVRLRGVREPFDAVISTVPFQLLRRALPRVEEPYFHALDRVEYFGVTCWVARTRRPLTKHFWLNINDPRISIPGIIEYTNLNPLPHLAGDRLLYVPQYLDPRDPRFGWDDDAYHRRYVAHLGIIEPSFGERDVVEWHVFRTTHAQPLCNLGFERMIPSMRTPLAGLYVTDSYLLQPDDRTISNSLRMGRDAAELLLEDVSSGRPSGGAAVA
ncbi:MAG: FAD-dependent oxidoreductase [bacterium]